MKSALNVPKYSVVKGSIDASIKSTFDYGSKYSDRKLHE